MAHGGIGRFRLVGGDRTLPPRPDIDLGRELGTPGVDGSLSGGGGPPAEVTQVVDLRAAEAALQEHAAARGPLAADVLAHDVLPGDVGVHRRPGPHVLRFDGRPAAHPDATEVLATYRRATLLADLLAALLSSFLAFGMRVGEQWRPDYVVLGLALPLIWVATLAGRGVYETRFLGVDHEEVRRVGTAGVVLLMVLAVMSYGAKAGLSRGYVLSAVPLTMLASQYARHRARRWLVSLRRDGIGVQKVLVVGHRDAATALARHLQREPQHGLAPVGACLPGPGAREVGVDLAEILAAVDELDVDVVAVVPEPDLSGPALRRLAWALEDRRVELVVSPGIVEVAGPRLSIRPVAGLSLLHLERPSMGGVQQALKTAFDLVLSTLLLLTAAPLMAAVALAVKASSPGPVLFRQRRIGVDGHEFTMLKFRSMVADAEAQRAAVRHLDDGNGMLFKAHADPRVTGVGRLIRKYSLDELPQLLNVLHRDMSLVGPRPPLPEEVAGYGHDAVRRLRVRPGLTGLWQVSGRSDLSWEESLRLDLRYVDNWSVTLDLVIIWRTLRAVLRGTGAY